MSPKTAIRFYKPLQLIHRLCCSLSELHRTASWDQQVLSDLRCSGAQGETSAQHPVREMSGLKISVCISWLARPGFFFFFFCLLSVFVCLFCVFIYCVPCLLLSSFQPFFLSIFLLSLLICLFLSFLKYFQFLLLLCYSLTFFSFLSTVHASCILLCHLHYALYHVHYFEMCNMCLVSRPR